MISTVLIVSSGFGFMAEALDSNLKKHGFMTKFAEHKVREIEEKKKDCDIILLLAGDYIYNSPETLVYLKDITVDEERPLCAIGHDEELKEIFQYIPQDHFKKVFTRPFDAKYIAEEVKYIAKAAEEIKQGKRILLVDDDPTFLKMLQGWLRDKYNITAVKSGMQAITYLANHSPDLILLDYDMPITPGPQVMEMIRSEYSAKEIPIIFLTGKSDRESIMRVMKLKPQGYLLKTMQRDDIVATIDNYFQTHRWDNYF
ncbi:MAG: response regulator [Butyrivibrio sp.]|nr:response regulator [Butyrivibrio sp.]